MSTLSVISAQSRRDRKQFIELPWSIYRNDPHWIPPLRQSVRELVGFAKHPFHQFAEVEAFLAVREGRPCGRIVAILNPTHNQRYHEQRGFFGFFECENDHEVAAALFERLRSWMAERGIQELRGPVNPSLNYECGLLIEGFDSRPTFMMPHNPPYYAELIEANGFGKVEDLYAFWGHREMLGQLDQKLDFVVQEATRRFNVKLRHLDRKRFDADVRMFLDIYNQSLGGTWGFTPLSEGEIRHLSKSLKHLIIPEMTSVAEVEGKPVAAAFALLDYNPIIKEIDGRLFPFGFLKLLTKRRHMKRVRLMSTNVVPEFQKWGLGLVILHRLVPDVLKWGIEEGEFSWVLESNHLSFKTLQRGGAKITKKYRIYDSPAPDTSATA